MYIDQVKEKQDIEAQVNREQLFIQTYMTLTGATECGARAVFMYVGFNECPTAEEAPRLTLEGRKSDH